jgi:hypothetical protein
MVTEKPTHSRFVELLDYKVTLAYPPREVRDTDEVSASSVVRVAALPQAIDERINVWAVQGHFREASPWG